MIRSKIKTLLLALIAVSLAASLMIYPKESFNASLRGLHIWWDVVFPSLLPFFIVSELLIGFGVVSFLGMLLEPFMRPFFRVPGIGGFVWAMGLASGYPAGAKLTARLRKEKKLTRLEAERLVSFTNSSNPLFLFGAISVGFFQNPSLGVIFALSHYLGNALVGLCMRFHGYREEKLMEKEKKRQKLSFKEAFFALHEERLKDGRPIGKLLGDAVQSSVQTLLMVGGFIIIFSVLNQLLYLLHITPYVAKFFSALFSMIGLSPEFSLPFVAGLFEITLGSQMTSQVENSLLFEKVLLTCFILAFHGFSVQAQVASILAETDIRFQPYFFARLLHGFFSVAICWLLWTPLYDNNGGNKQTTVPVFWQNDDLQFISDIWQHFLTFSPIITLTFIISYIFIITKKALFSKEEA